MSEPTGKIILSCGCEFTDDMGDMEGLYVRFRDEVCDAVDGSDRSDKALAYAESAHQRAVWPPRRVKAMEK